MMADSPEPDVADKTAELVICGPQRPDGVYATVDTLAEALIRRTAEEGLDVPGGMLIATCSDGYIARSTSPALTTIDEKPIELGEAAVTMLIGAILDPGTRPKSVRVDTELLARASTQP